MYFVYLKILPNESKKPPISQEIGGFCTTGFYTLLQ